MSTIKTSAPSTVERRVTTRIGLALIAASSPGQHAKLSPGVPAVDLS